MIRRSNMVFPCHRNLPRDESRESMYQKRQDCQRTRLPVQVNVLSDEELRLHYVQAMWLTDGVCVVRAERLPVDSPQPPVRSRQGTGFTPTTDPTPAAQEQHFTHTIWKRDTVTSWGNCTSAICPLYHLSPSVAGGCVTSNENYLMKLQYSGSDNRILFFLSRGFFFCAKARI